VGEIGGSPGVLEAIVAAARRVVEVRKAVTPVEQLERVADAQPTRHGRLARALTGGSTPRVIAECKRRSPSRGILRANYDPAAIAASYARAGAVAISVLTEPTFFDGSLKHLQAVRAAVDLPVLRKDFIVDRYQLVEACAWGADAALLIVAALTDAELRSLIATAETLAIDALVEVHDRNELTRALDAGARVLGVNNRNLKTLEVSTRVAEDLAAAIPEETIAVAESGLSSRAHLDRLSAAGYDAFLIGERFMTARDPGVALKEMLA
jgi:indole-3-glycerol phosphate synthase